MRAIIQRVRSAKVVVGQQAVAAIGSGLLILLGIGHGDTAAEGDFLAEKCAYLRIFEDEEGKTNLSVQEVRGEALVVSQFTLYADAHKGRRPSFTEAALPEAAEPLISRFAETLGKFGIPTKMGAFGAHMLVELTNDGPFTIILETPPLKT